MARSNFGGSDTGALGIQAPSTKGGVLWSASNISGGTAWSAATGGTQYTDLILPGGGATTVRTDGDGFVRAMQGPNGVNEGMWVDLGSGRFWLRTTDSLSTMAAVLIAAERVTERANQSATYGTLVQVGGKANRDGLRVSVWDYGVVGDGVADDSAALQAAINAAGVGGYIDAGKGTRAAAVFKCLTGLTMLNFQILDGSSMEVGVGGTAGAEIRFPSFTAAEVGLTLGDACTVKNLCVRGPGSGVGTCKGAINGGSAARFHSVSFIHWATGALMTAAYYAAFYDCEFSRNATGLALSACFNVSVFGTRFFCGSSSGTTYGVGIDTGTVRGLTVTGGSIESFGASGGIKLGVQSNVTVIGTYWESDTGGATGGFGIACAVTIDKTSLNLIGNTVYLTELSRWVGFTGATNSALNSQGNHFICPVTSSTTPIAYVFGTAATTTDVNITGDSWAEVAKGTYADNAANWPVAGWNIQQPNLVATHGALAYQGREVVMRPGTTVNASLRIPHGVAPSAPVNGDMWSTTAGLFIRINGVTKTVTLT